jgi:two-component system LytT family response regulator
MKIVLVDDEPLALQGTQMIITENCKGVDVVGLASNIVEARQLIESEKPDLVLCDIQMPGGSGFDLLDGFKEPTFQVVFVTAFDNYAIKAFEYSAIDYLLKPFSSKNLVEVIEKAKSNKSKEDNLVQLKALLDNKEEVNTLVISGHDKIHAIKINDLAYLEADSNYTKIVVVSNEEEVLCSKTLKNFEDQLPAQEFFRVHRSFIINRERVQFFSPKTGIVTLKGGHEICVSQRRLKPFLEWLG